MLRKTVSLGLVLLLAGSGLLMWVQLEQRKSRQLEQSQREKAEANLKKLKEVAGDKIDTRQFEGISIDSNIQEMGGEEKVKEQRGLLLTISGILLLSGGMVTAVSLLLAAAGAISRGLKGEKKDMETPDEKSALHENKKQSGRQPEKHDKKDKKDYSLPHPEELQSVPKTQGMFASFVERQRKEAAKRAEKVQAGCTIAAQGETVAAVSREDVPEKASITAEEPAGRACAEAPQGGDSSDGAGGPEVEPVKHRSSTKKIVRMSIKPEPARDVEPLQVDRAVPAEAMTACAKTGTIEAEEDDDGIQSRTIRLEEQMERLKQMANLQGSDNGSPVEESLKLLTEQVSAIREYASHQQERVTKLQEGYDWNIVRNFCLRVIRCIDNIETRIERVSEESPDAVALEEVKDELIFALESTGVEQFRPELQSDYRGQERNTEAVTEKEPCEQAGLAGKIAKVLRPGYHYYIDESHVKLVRMAQVKLYS
jgi:molecular chaperone GrpE (heat shock protein)/UPF0716 family protein affecting phage T7 exclusion